MNKFLLTSLSVLALAACINDVEDVQEPNTDSNYKTVYLPIQFVATGANVTRAGDASQEGTVAGSTESSFTTTNNLELYFYDEKGTDFDFLAEEGLNEVLHGRRKTITPS
jgi:opacity protein-like surface antigen